MVQHVITPTGREIMFKQCNRLIMMNPLVFPNYYTALFQSFKGLLIPDHVMELDALIFMVEESISDEFNAISLREAEVLMQNNIDLSSGFVVNGVLVTQQTIYARLEYIKQWLIMLLYQFYLPGIRFLSPVEFT